MEYMNALVNELSDQVSDISRYYIDSPWIWAIVCPDWFLLLGCQVNDGNKSINKSIILLNLMSSPVTLALHTLLPVNSLTGGIALKS